MFLNMPREGSDAKFSLPCSAFQACVKRKGRLTKVSLSRWKHEQNFL